MIERCLRPERLVIVFAAAALAVIPTPAQESGSPADPGAADNADAATAFEAFSLLWERNVFDPNRMPAPSGAPVAALPTPPPDDRIQLTGVLIVGGERVAFFEGTQGDFNAHGRAGDPVGEFRIERVGIDGVDLSIAETRLEIPVGKAAVSSGDGEWRVVEVEPPAAYVAGAPPTPSTPPAAEASSQPFSPPPAPASADGAPGSASAASTLEQLKARRRQELGQQ